MNSKPSGDDKSAKKYKALAAKTFLEASQKASSEASARNRELSFAGLASIWILRNPSSQTTAIDLPPELALAALLFAAALAVDLAHYVIRSLIWLHFYNMANDSEKTAPSRQQTDRWAIRIDRIWILKLLVVGWAYYCLASYIVPLI